MLTVTTPQLVFLFCHYFVFFTTLIGRYASRKAAQVLHGGGTFSNSGNRWFDKTLQVSSCDDSHRTTRVHETDAPVTVACVFA